MHPKFRIFFAASALLGLGLAACTSPATSTANPPVKGSLPALRVSDNGHYFVKADGTPFFWLGDTAWTIFNHPKPEEVDAYLDNRAAKGFTVIQGCIAVWDYRSRRNPDGQTPFLNNDPTMINEAFFKNVDSIVDKAAAHGLYVAMLPYWTKRTPATSAFANPETMKAYCHWLAKRYAAKNVIWVLGGDSEFTAQPETQAVTDAEAEGLLAGAREAGVAKIMITYHPTGRQSSSFWFQTRPWLDFNSIQSGHFIRTTNFRLVADDYAKIPVKPTLDMEPGYENITDRLVRTDVTADTPRIQAADVRRSAYLAVFAGAAGHSYGNGEVYEFWAPGQSAALPGWAAGLPWRESLNLPGSTQVQYLRYLIESRPPLIRQPDQSLIVKEDNLPVLERIEALRAADGSYAFVYTATGRPLTLRLDKLSGSKLNGWWYDPRTGAATAIPAFAKSETKEFTPPSAGNDWVLVLDDASKKFPAPGRIGASKD